MDDKLVDEKVAAGILGISAATLRRQRSRGADGGEVAIVPFVRLGARCIRYSVNDLHETIRARRVEAV